MSVVKSIDVNSNLPLDDKDPELSQSYTSFGYLVQTGYSPEVDKWTDGRGYVMRKQDRILFNQMLSGVNQHLA
jgi:hypothetical protein